MEDDGGRDEVLCAAVLSTAVCLSIYLSHITDTRSAVCTFH